MSRDLRQNTDQYVTVGPFIDQGDGKTLKNDLTVTNIKGIFSIQTHSAAATDSDEFTCSATGSDDWGLVSQGHGGLYQLKIPDSVDNFVGSGFLSLYYGTSYLPVWHEFRVLPANVWDAWKGADLLQVDLTQVNGAAQTATLDTIKAAIDTDTVAEMAQGAPPATASLKQMVNYLYRKLRNKQETTATVNSVYDDAGTTILFKETHSDDATTFSRGEYISGA